MNFLRISNAYHAFTGTYQDIRKSSLIIAMASGLLLCGSVAAPTAAQESGVLEEIIVTAQKREESLLDVPLSITVTRGETIQRQNLRSLHDLTVGMPGVQVAEGGPSDSQYIRGVGSGINSSFEQSVGTFVDGIYHGRARLSRGTFMDLDRIEVLKGPQSTFFGNNAIAGAFNITTKKPGEKFEGSITALYEPGDDEYSAELAMGGPVFDTLGARVALKVSGMEGFIEDLGAGSHVPDIDNQYGCGTFVWTPNDTFDATFKVEIGKWRRRGSVPVQLQDCPPPAPFPSPGMPPNFCDLDIALGVEDTIDKSRNTSPGQVDELNTREYVVTLNYEKWGHTFTSVTGYSNYDYGLFLDIDVTPV